jgi:hypothetical protein
LLFGKLRGMVLYRDMNKPGKFQKRFYKKCSYHWQESTYFSRVTKEYIIDESKADTKALLFYFSLIH